MDPVDPKELKGKHADRKDKDIDNDGDVDSSDKYLHKKRKAITKNVKDDEAGNDDAIKEKVKESVDVTNEDATHETESGTAKITKTHVHFDNSGYKQKFSHKEVHKMSNGGKVRGFSLEKDNPYHGKDNHVYSNGDEEHHLPTKHLAKLNKESVDMDEAADMDDKNVEKAMKHDCATHVTHEEHGAGECIPGMHTLVPANEEMEEWEAVVSHYDVMFKDTDGKPFIVENVPIEELKIDKSESHMHKRKK